MSRSTIGAGVGAGVGAIVGLGVGVGVGTGVGVASVAIEKWVNLRYVGFYTYLLRGYQTKILSLWDYQ